MKKSRWMQCNKKDQTNSSRWTHAHFSHLIMTLHKRSGYQFTSPTIDLQHMHNSALAHYNAVQHTTTANQFTKCKLLTTSVLQYCVKVYCFKNQLFHDSDCKCSPTVSWCLCSYQFLLELYGMQFKLKHGCMSSLIALISGKFFLASQWHICETNN